jgi:hypothetical protein
MYCVVCAAENAAPSVSERVADHGICVLNVESAAPGSRPLCVEVKLGS